MASFVRVLQNLGLLLARLGLGAILLMHGWMRWNAGVQEQINYLTQFRTPYAEVAAWGAIIFELVGGVLLIVGALTRFVGLGVLIEQILIIAYTNWYKWPPTLLHAAGSYKGGYEYNVALGLLGLLLFVMGGGAVSIDRLFRRRKPTPEEEEDELAEASTTRAAMVSYPTPPTHPPVQREDTATPQGFTEIQCQAWRMIRTDATAGPLTRPDGTPIRILAVDDESSLTELLSMAMRYEGWQVSTAASGGQAVKVARETRPDAIVLDMMLPDFDGLEVMRRIRAEDPDVPVIFLTAKDSVEDRIGGLTAGGDDYVTKPFSLEEVIARLRALLRRTGAALARSDSTLVVGDLVLDEDSHEVRRGGTEIQLTATEFELLRYLMPTPRAVPSKAQILDRVWNYDFGGQANVVELYISYLRKKIDANRAPMIHTLRGAGYVLRPAATSG